MPARSDNWTQRRQRPRPPPGQRLPGDAVRLLRLAPPPRGGHPAHSPVVRGTRGTAVRTQRTLPGGVRAQSEPVRLDHEPGLRPEPAHADARRTDKHVKPLAETALLVENPSTRGLTTSSPDFRTAAAGRKRLTGSRHLTKTFRREKLIDADAWTAPVNSLPRPSRLRRCVEPGHGALKSVTASALSTRAAAKSS
jgi:hypothetical protein